MPRRRWAWAAVRKWWTWPCLARASSDALLRGPFGIENVRDSGVDPLPELVVRVHELHADAGERAALLRLLLGDPMHDHPARRDGVRAAGKLHLHLHHRLQRRGILGVHEYASGADVRGVLEHEVLNVSEADGEPDVVAGKGAPRVFLRVERHGTDRLRIRRTLAARQQLADLRQLRLTATGELRPEARLLILLRVLTDHSGQVERVARAGEVELHLQGGARGRRRQAPDQHAADAQLPRGGLHRQVSSREADGKDDRGALHACPRVYLTARGRKGAAVVRGASG